MPRTQLLLLTAFFAPALAFANPTPAEIPCKVSEPGVISADGILDDWEGEPGLELGNGSADFSLTIKCNYDHDTLYLLVDVKDDVLVRTKAARPGEDHLELAFARRGHIEKLVIHPGDSRSGVPRKVAWAPARALGELDIADALQPAGWAVEMRMPLASVPGWAPGSSSIRIGVAAFDADSPKAPHIETTLATGPLDSADHLGTIEFAHTRAALEAFLRDRNLTEKDIRFEQVGSVFPGCTGRVVLAGNTIALIGEEYSYLSLPVHGPEDVGETRLCDLSGDGQDVIITRYREKVSTGVREVLAAYRMAGDGLRRVFAVEIGKQQGKNRLATKVSFVKRGRATDIVVEPLPATGWTEATYRELPAEDIAPILAPWGADKRARFQFRGEEYLRAE